MNPSAIDTLLEAATLAPSGDNTQPWQFAVDRNRGTIRIAVDPTRDPSPMNSGQRMARIAIGAAIENLLRTADRNRWAYDLSFHEDQIEFKLDQLYGPGSIDPLLSRRRTNRKLYHAAPIADDQWERLQASASEAADGAIHFIPRGDAFSTLVDLVSQADAQMFTIKAVRDAFLKNVRFDQPATSVVDFGLSLGSLEVAKPEQLALRMMRFTPDTVLRAFGAGRVFKQTATSLAESASGFCLITSSETGARADFAIGRAMQRAWLALTQERFAAQPMMSLLVLQNMVDQASPVLGDGGRRAAAESLLHQFYRFVATFTPGRPGALMRFGSTDEPSVQIGRLPLSASTVERD